MTATPSWMWLFHQYSNTLISSVTKDAYLFHIGIRWNMMRCQVIPCTTDFVQVAKLSDCAFTWK